MNRRSGFRYQVVLIVSAIAAVIVSGVFIYRELNPEYALYQTIYQELEEFRSSFTGKAPPPFKPGVKQIVIPQETGPETIDRCISCHVAMKFEHFSPTMLEKDINGKIVRDAEGNPVEVPNPNYIWGKLDQKIADLRDEDVNRQLKKEGEAWKVSDRLSEAEKLEKMKTVHVGEHTYDVTKVLRMHPLMPGETRPFEFHSMEKMGCTSCHGGNGRGLVTDRAHGPVFDGQYEAEFMGPKPQFLEEDPQNDPQFSKVFNDKPGSRLLFQTTPILIGNLIQSRCIECHKRTDAEISQALGDVSRVADQRQERVATLKESLIEDLEAVHSLVFLAKSMLNQGVEKTLDLLKKEANEYSLPEKVRKNRSAQLDYLSRLFQQAPSSEERKDVAIKQIRKRLVELAGSREQAMQLTSSQPSKDSIAFLKNIEWKESGEIERKWKLYQQELRSFETFQAFKSPLQEGLINQEINSSLGSRIDQFTEDFQRGERLFISQGCYACHRIAGFTRGGVGPELTDAGESYPWFLKESIVWPQADLKTSTMPNMKLDHEEVEDLMTFLLAQHSNPKKRSTVDREIEVNAWEAGEKKQEFEKELPPTKVLDVDYGMLVFATEGCAACHRLKGYTSSVGFTGDQEDSSFDLQFQNQKWFEGLFPEDVIGSEIVSKVERFQPEIDEKISEGENNPGLLEKIEQVNPGTLESFYSNFKYALRAKDAGFDLRLRQAKTEDAKQAIVKEKKDWKRTVQNVLLMFIQNYGLGRQIGPKVNWSGIYRSDQWLMEHFWNPSGHLPKSIMPVFPFDNSKFLALTYMLDALAVKNRNDLKKIWNERGFNPEATYELLCSQCHGQFLQGNGPVSEWIYPIPKNLRNTAFLRNLTREKAIESITHGVKGTPMAPWGEAATDKDFGQPVPVLGEKEISSLVDWIYQVLPETNLQPTEVPKWEYGPDDVIKELQGSNGELKTSYQLQHSNDEIAYRSSNEKSESSSSSEIENVFDVVKNPFLEDVNEKQYFIKKKLYTQENIQDGKEYFEINCASCHGTEGDGSGMRAGTMQMAKPRAFTNLDWLHTRDDLRLLRSIKFGVAGTSMSPWGDQTTPLQRLQLVMYIRSLSSDQDYRDALLAQIYRTFDTMKHQVSLARSLEFQEIEQTKEELSNVRKGRKQSLIAIQKGEENPQKAADLYAKELTLLRTQKELEQKDRLFQQINSLIDREKSCYKETGTQIIAIFGDAMGFDQFLSLIELNQGRFQFIDKQLQYQASDQEKIDQIFEEIKKELALQLDELEKEKVFWKSKFSSQEQKNQLETIGNRIQSLEKGISLLTKCKAETKRLRDQMKSLFKEYQTSTQQGMKSNESDSAV